MHSTEWCLLQWPWATPNHLKPFSFSQSPFSTLWIAFLSP